MSTDQPTDLLAVHYSTLKLSHFTLDFFFEDAIILQNHFPGSI